MLLSYPRSLGKRFRWHELRIRKRMPSSILRWSTRLRPFALGGPNSKITSLIRPYRPSVIPHIVGRISLFPIIHHHTTFPYLNQSPDLFPRSHQSYLEIVTKGSRQIREPFLLEYLDGYSISLSNRSMFSYHSLDISVTLPLGLTMT